MIIAENISAPFTASLNGQPPQTVKQHLVTYMLGSEKDIEEFQAEMVKGRDVVLQFESGGNTYVILRDFIPSKIAMSNPGKLPPLSGVK